MKLANMFLAEAAEVSNDTLQVRGAFWDGLDATRFPAEHEIVVVLAVRPRATDVSNTFHVDLEAVGPDGRQVGHHHGDLVLNKFRQQTAFAVSFRATFPTAGRYSVRLRSAFGEDELFFQVVASHAAAVEGYALGLRG